MLRVAGVRARSMMLCLRALTQPRLARATPEVTGTLRRSPTPIGVLECDIWKLVAVALSHHARDLQGGGRKADGRPKGGDKGKASGKRPHAEEADEQRARKHKKPKVTAKTKCFKCQGYGHIAVDCTQA